MNVKAQCSKARLLAIAEAHGLAVRSGRMQCPERCSEDPRGATVDDSENGALWSCKRCGKGGSVIDFFQSLDGLGLADAIAVAEESLGIIPEPPAAKHQERRDPLKTWQATTDNDPPGLAYLRGRGLDGAVALGAVRFNTGRANDSWVDAQASAGYRIAMPLRDRHGTIVSVQLRSVNKGADPTKLSLAKCPYQCSVGLGDPVRASKAATVFLAEGMADTLALTIAGVDVIGAPGADQLHRLVDLVGDPRGRRFVLCPQNDKEAIDKKTGLPKVWRLPDGTESTGRQSALFFDYAGKLLRERGAEVLTLETPAPAKDPAEWLGAVGRDKFSALITALAGPAISAAPPAPGPRPALRSVPNDPSQGDSTDGSAALAVEEAPKGLSKSYASLCHILRTTALREIILGPGDLEFNAQTLLPTIGRKPLDEDVASSVIRERCETRLRTNRSAGGIKFPKSDIDQALIAIAREKTYNPVADYLRGLKWDGVERLNHICDDLFECEKTEITDLLMRRWMISAVARALRPGCKVDTVLILVGAGGRKKSTFFEELVGAEWFSDSSITIGDKDAYLLLRRVWVLEWAELEAMQKAARAGAVKAFIASRSDYFRPPYARSMRAVPRTSVIVGTTNENEPLSDPTGNRRYWPIRITGEIYLDGVRAQRDQLWAEAVAAFDKGERWWLESTEDAVLDRTRQAYEQRDPWEDLVAEIVHEKDGITTNWILDQLRVDISDRNRGHQMRVAAIMGSGRLNYVKRKPVVDGRRTWVWVKEKPEQRALGLEGGGQHDG